MKRNCRDIQDPQLLCPSQIIASKLVEIVKQSVRENQSSLHHYDIKEKATEVLVVLYDNVCFVFCSNDMSTDLFCYTLRRM